MVGESVSSLGTMPCVEQLYLEPPMVRTNRNCSQFVRKQA